MEEKLRSILKRSHWSLAIRAAVFALAWLFIAPLSFAAFAVVALYLYFFPAFRSLRLFLPFVILLVLSAISPASGWVALLFGAMFFILLGIKELVLVDRVSMYQYLCLLILFLCYLNYFSRFQTWLNGALLVAALLAAAFYFLIGDGKRHIRAAIATAAFIIWQITAALLFLPQTFMVQTAVIFIFCIICTEFLYNHYAYYEKS